MCMARGGAPTPNGHTAEDQICCILRLVYKNSRLPQTYHSTDSLCSQVNVSELILINSLKNILVLRCMLTVYRHD